MIVDMSLHAKDLVLSPTLTQRLLNTIYMFPS